MRVHSLHRYPVKGFSGEELAEVTLMPGGAFPEDRRFGFALARSNFDPAAPVWLPKRNFACGMLHARVAAVRLGFDSASFRLSLDGPGAAPLVADLSQAEGRAAAAAWMSAFLAGEAEGPLRLAEAPGESLADIPQKAVHIIGLASIAALGERMGVALDPRRFRANLLLADSPAFAELDWVGRELRIGAVRLRVFDRTARCAATEVNPVTAERDARPQRALRDHYGHVDMGVFAEVLEGGRLAPGDAVTLLEA